MVPGCSHCWIGARKTDLAVIDMTAPSVVVVLVHAYCVSLTIAKVKAAVRAMLFDGIEGVRAGINSSRSRPQDQKVMQQPPHIAASRGLDKSKPFLRAYKCSMVTGEAEEKFTNVSWRHGEIKK